MRWLFMGQSWPAYGYFCWYDSTNPAGSVCFRSIRQVWENAYAAGWRAWASRGYR